MKKLKAVVMGLAVGLAFSGMTGSVLAQDKQLIKIGIRSTGIDMVESFRQSVEEAGFSIEETVFDDAVQPNVAVDEGSVDINLFQHEAYMTAFNENNGTSLAMVEPTIYYGRYCMYSDKHENLDSIPDGAIVAISNDPANQDRGLKMLQDLGLITLSETEEVYTILDVADNPHNFEFITANNSLLPQTLNDVDYVLCTAVHMKNAGLDPTSYIAEAEDGADYRVGFVVDESNHGEQWVQDFVDAALTEDFYHYLEERGTDVPLFEFDAEGNREIKDLAVLEGQDTQE